MPELSDEELDALVEEATVDAYGEDEQLGGFAVMIEDNLEVPFETTVLGVTVQEVLRCPRVGMSGRVRPARLHRPVAKHPPAAAGRGTRRSLVGL